MGREGRGLGEQRRSYCGIFRLEDYIFNNHNFFLKANGNVSLQLRGRETQERGEKTQRAISPTGLESDSRLCSGGFQERGGQVALGAWGCLLSPGLLWRLTGERRTEGISLSSDSFMATLSYARAFPPQWLLG